MATQSPTSQSSDNEGSILARFPADGNGPIPKNTACHIVDLTISKQDKDRMQQFSDKADPILSGAHILSGPYQPPYYRRTISWLDCVLEKTKTLVLANHPELARGKAATGPIDVWQEGREEATG
jgi:hypothetical protein